MDFDSIIPRLKLAIDNAPSHITLVKIVATVFALVFGYIFYHIFKFYLKRRQYRKFPGPKPSGIKGFFFGNYFDIIDHIKSGKLYPELMREWSKQYGSVFVYQFLNQFVLITTEPQAIRDILVENTFPKHAFVYKPVGYPVSARFTGDGIFTGTDIEKYRQTRPLFNPAFHRNVMNDCVKKFNEKGLLFIEKLRILADGKTVFPFFEEFNRVTFDVIAAVAFGMNTDTINDPSFSLNRNIATCLKAMNETIFDPLVEYKPSQRKTVKEFRKTITEVRNFAKDRILERLKEMESSQGVFTNDILSIIIKQSKEDSFDLENMVDNFVTFFVAGQETTANSLSFAFMELGLNPKILEKLKEEVDRVLGSKPEISNDDLNNLVYTGCVFKESLRKWPPATKTFRTNPVEFTINEYTIPKNTYLQPMQYLMQRNEKFFPNPDEFLPERFLPDSEESKRNKINGSTYFPFAVGERNCIGQNFAIMEGKILIAKIIQNFDFKLDKNQSFGAHESLTMRPTDGCRITLSMRH